MKKTLILLLAFIITFLPACAAGNSNLKSTEKEGVGEMRIKIEIISDSGYHVLMATLADNSSAVAFYELLKRGLLTVDMHDYGSFEKVGSLGTSLPRNDTQITTTAGDIILYQGNQITIYYDTNSWNFTRLGKVVSTLQQGSVSTGSTTGVTQAELKKILGKGNVKAVFSAMTAEETLQSTLQKK